MKRLKFLLPLLLGVLLLIPTHIFSQDKKKEKKPREKDFVSLEFNLNYSFVLGKYGQVDKTTYTSGYAKNGWVAQLGLNWLGKRGFGLGFQWDLQRNGYKDTAANINPYGTKYPLGTSGWTNNFIMAGLVMIKDIGKWEINAKALFGVCFSQSSNFNVQNPVDGSNVSVTAAGIGYGFSLAGGYRFNKHWAVNLNVNYLGANPKATKQYGSEIIGYEEIKDPVTGTLYYSAIYSAPTKYEIKKTVSTINTGIGVIYHF